MRRATLLPLLAALLLSLSACGGKAAPTEVVVSAAASLTDVLTEAQKTFAPDHPDVTIRFNFGSSGALRQQIEQGAPVDLFISAAAEPMDSLVQKGRVDRDTLRTLATNHVVLVKAQSAQLTGWADLKSDAVKKIAIGNPDHVPAGQYGKAVLDKLGLWDAVLPRLVLGEDVRQVLNYVAAGDAEAGIVYRTDAAAAKGVTIVAEAPAGSHPPVVYPMAVLKDSHHAADARAFANFLRSPAGKAILSQYGFTPAD